MFFTMIFVMLLKFAIVSFPTEVGAVDTLDQRITFVRRFVFVMPVHSPSVFDHLFVRRMLSVYLGFGLDILFVIKLNIEA